MEHVLLQCPATGQDTIWSCVRSFLSHRRTDFDPTLGSVLGCANLACAGSWGSRNKAVERSLRIVVSESAFMIWKIRCEKTIAHADDPDWQLSAEAIHGRWNKMLSVRYHRDLKLTNKSRYGRRALDRDLVNWTWRDLADPIATGFTAMKYGLGVLVGREGREPAVGVG
ncbi:hypothetical protein AURDEDRAFT_61167 [Auricularia subglabra TFB-10046 SS5]|nr:hypothetical protein AURDEDRAFT_61167 [Auricularia subglabra TFB-10046 SS5]